MTGIQVLEGALHAAAAVLLGCVVSVASAYLLAGAAGREPWSVVASGPWRELAIVGTMTLMTTIVAVVLSTHLGKREPLAQQLHVQD